MKKFLSILAAVMVAVISVFSLSGNYKNSAEPQYFYKTSIAKGYEINTDNTDEFYLDLYLDPNVNLDTNLERLIFLTINPCPFTLMIEIFNYQNESVIFGSYDMYEQTQPFEFYFESINDGNDKFNRISFTDDTICEKYFNDTPTELYENRWYDHINTNEFVHGITINLERNQVGDLSYNLDEDALTTMNNYTGDSIEFSTAEPNPTVVAPDYTQPDTPEQTTTPLTQIGSIITDTIGWFTNIFTGLSAAFYVDGELTTWGTVLFIGVAITLIAMVLKWLISLIKGV